jgi:enterochelin esterase-like enzyme
LLDRPWSISPDLQDPRTAVWNILTLHQTTYLADIALLYALLLSTAPLGFILLSERHTSLVLGVSWGLWAIYQIYPGGAELPWRIDDNNLFHFSAWQVLFFSAMVLGYHRDWIRRRLKAAWDGPLLAATGLGVVALVAVYVMVPEVRAGSLGLSDAWLAKNDVGAGRIAASVVVFAFAWLATARFWVQLRQGVGWLVLPLGQNALFAYSAHVVIALALGIHIAVLRFLQLPVLPIASIAEPGVINAVLQIGSLTAIWLAIRLRLVWPTPASRGAWVGGSAPVAIALAILLWTNPAPGPHAPGVAPSAPAANSLGTPIPPQQLADIAKEIAADNQAKAVAVDSTGPRPAAVLKVPTTPQPLPVPRAPAPGLADLPGQLWTDSTGPTAAHLQGSVRSIVFHSQALDRDMTYLAYIPAGYGRDGPHYPVLYLLHGSGQRVDEWLSYGAVETADRMIAAGALRPMLIVMPQGDIGYWVNHVGDGPRWGDYVTSDLIKQIDATFRTQPDAKHRAIGGLSMGGYGALVLAFTHPSLFESVGASSPTLHTEGSLPELGTGPDYAARDPVGLATSAPVDGLNIWLDIGATDPWLPRVAKVDAALNARNIQHTWMVGDGGHDSDYWQHNLAAYLNFYNAAFNQSR